MKKIISLLLIISLSIGAFTFSVNANTFINANNGKVVYITSITDIVKNWFSGTKKAVDDINNAKDNQTELNKKIRELFDKQVVKDALDGKTIREVLEKEVGSLTATEKKNIKNIAADISFDKSNFENDEKTFLWIEDTLKIVVKALVDRGEVTEESVAEYKNMLQLIGVNISDIKIEKGMSDADIEKLCIALVDTANKVANPTMLKLLGIDLKNINLHEQIK